MKLTPAQDFVKSQAFRGWLDRVSEPQFQEAAKSALLEYGMEVAGKPDGSVKFEGAKRFLEVLMNLGESKPVIERKDTINLTHR